MSLVKECANPECKKHFIPVIGKQKYCSRQCGNFFHNHSEYLKKGLPVIKHKRGPKRRKPIREKTNFHDSTLTLSGRERERIYVFGGGKAAKAAAIKDFMIEKKPINEIEKIYPFKRKLDCSIGTGGGESRYDSAREILLQRQEYADAAFYYMRFIL